MIKLILVIIFIASLVILTLSLILECYFNEVGRCSRFDNINTTMMVIALASLMLILFQAVFINMPDRSLIEAQRYSECIVTSESSSESLEIAKEACKYLEIKK